MKTKYRPTKGAMFNAAQAARLGAALESLGDSVKPKQLVDFARPKSSPIHDLFEWDTAKAAESYRLWQARHHVSHITVVVVTSGGSEDSRGFHSVRVEADSAERSYVSTGRILGDSELSQQVIEAALRQLEGWRKRYAIYRDVFGEVFKAVAKAKKKIRRRRKTVAA